VKLDNSWKIKKEAMEHYNSSAHLYTQQYCKEQASKYAVALDEVKIGKNEFILDVGCGTGLFIKEIAERVGVIIGIDTSRRMIEIAKDKCKKLRNVNLICGDADYMPLQKKFIDKIFSFTVLQNIPEVHQIIREVLCIAKSDSKIILTFNKKAFNCKEVRRLLTKLKLVITNFIDREDVKDYIVVSIMR
jgi:ubiquinone/menaquinone biosynthesis C-methylase UbiE